MRTECPRRRGSPDRSRPCRPSAAPGRRSVLGMCAAPDEASSATAGVTHHTRTTVQLRQRAIFRMIWRDVKSCDFVYQLYAKTVRNSPEPPQTHPRANGPGDSANAVSELWQGVRRQVANVNVMALTSSFWADRGSPVPGGNPVGAMNDVAHRPDVRATRKPELLPLPICPLPSRSAEPKNEPRGPCIWVARTIARMPAWIAGGSVGQVPTRSAKSGGRSGASRGVGEESVPDSVPPAGGICGFPVEFADCSHPLGVLKPLVFPGVFS
jgi:hypothetical protein